MKETYKQNNGKPAPCKQHTTTRCYVHVCVHRVHRSCLRQSWQSNSRLTIDISAATHQFLKQNQAANNMNSNFVNPRKWLQPPLAAATTAASMLQLPRQVQCSAVQCMHWQVSTATRSNPIRILDSRHVIATCLLRTWASDV